MVSIRLVIIMFGIHKVSKIFIKLVRCLVPGIQKANKIFGIHKTSNMFSITDIWYP